MTWINSSNFDDRDLKVLRSFEVYDDLVNRIFANLFFYKQDVFVLYAIVLDYVYNVKVRSAEDVYKIFYDSLVDALADEAGKIAAMVKKRCEEIFADPLTAKTSYGLLSGG